MMGKKGSAGRLFYQFSLEERVPQDHLLRRVAANVDFSFVRRMTARFYSHTGQPSIDPVVIFKMSLLSFLYGIASERRLVQEIQLNLAYLWFIGYDLDEPVPNHSVLSKARERYGCTLYLGFFKQVVQQCEKAGLVQGSKLFADSTLVQANADSDSLASRALVSQLPDIGEHVSRLWQDNPDPDNQSSNQVSAPIGPTPTRLRTVAPVPAGVTASARGALSDGCAPMIGKPIAGPIVPSKSDALPETPPAEITPEAKPSLSNQATPTTPIPSLHLANKADPPNKAVGLLNERMVSQVDPEAELVRRARVPAGLYYKIHATVDGGQARIITAVEVTGGGVADEHLLERLIREHEGNVGRAIGEVGADAKYGTAENYQMLERLGILASVPMRPNGVDQRVASAGDFAYDPKSDSFSCPNGQHLKRQGLNTTDAGQVLIIYRARPKQCAGCPLKEKCCGKAKARSVSRPDDGGLRDRVAAYLATPQARQTIRRRKAWIETVFGDGKERRGQRRARCRGVDKMRFQACMIAIAQDVRQLALRKTSRPGTGAAGLEKGSRDGLVGVSLHSYRTNANHNHNHNLTLKVFLN